MRGRPEALHMHWAELQWQSDTSLSSSVERSVSGVRKKMCPQSQPDPLRQLQSASWPLNVAALALWQHEELLGCMGLDRWGRLAATPTL